MWDAKFAAADKEPPNAYRAVYHTISERFTWERQQKLPKGTKSIKIPPMSKNIYIEHPIGTEDNDDVEMRKPKPVKLAMSVWVNRNLAGEESLFLLDD